MLPGRVLVIADLHIGAEHEFRRAGIKIPSQTGKMLERITSLVRQTKARKLIILGDIKHKVPGLSFQEEREVPHFIGTLANETGADVEIVPGNHDDGLQNLLPAVRFHPSTGLLLGDVYLTHGHTWPSADMLEASHVISGHRHPVIELRDRLGYVWRERAWVRTTLDKSKLKKRFKSLGKSPGKPLASAGLVKQEFIMMPAFNEMVGGSALNKKKQDFKLKRRPTPLGPLIRAAKARSAKVYLLDGTYLGELGKL
jgi:putative SbcD/Mre11-related phosphoesterase